MLLFCFTYQVPLKLYAMKKFSFGYLNSQCITSLCLHMYTTVVYSNVFLDHATTSCMMGPRVRMRNVTL